MLPCSNDIKQELNLCLRSEVRHIDRMLIQVPVLTCLVRLAALGSDKTESRRRKAKEGKDPEGLGRDRPRVVVGSPMVWLSAPLRSRPYIPARSPPCTHIRCKRSHDVTLLLLHHLLLHYAARLVSSIPLADPLRHQSNLIFASPI